MLISCLGCIKVGGPDMVCRVWPTASRQQEDTSKNNLQPSPMTQLDTVTALNWVELLRSCLWLWLRAGDGGLAYLRMQLGTCEKAASQHV